MTASTALCNRPTLATGKPCRRPAGCQLTHRDSSDRAASGDGAPTFYDPDEVVLDLTDDSDDRFDAVAYLHDSDFTDLDELPTDALGELISTAQAWGRDDELVAAGTEYVTRPDADEDTLDTLGRRCGDRNLLEQVLSHPNTGPALYADAWRHSPELGAVTERAAVARASAASPAARLTFLNSLRSERQLRAAVVTELYHAGVPVDGRFLVEAAGVDAGVRTSDSGDTDRYGRTASGDIPVVEIHASRYGGWAPTDIRETARKLGGSLGEFRTAAIAEAYGDRGLVAAFHITSGGKVTEIRDPNGTQARQVRARLEQLRDPNDWDDDATLHLSRINTAERHGEWTAYDRQDLARAWAFVDSKSA